jgi:hypothetical protein
MSQSDQNRVTFAILDREEGLPDLPPQTNEEYPLPAWYRSVYNVPLDELRLEDICKACRQRIHVEHTVPRALTLLKADPLAGEMYDGELLVSLKPIPPVYWSTHEDDRLTLKPLIEAVLKDMEVAENVRQDVEELLHRATSFR